MFLLLRVPRPPRAARSAVADAPVLWRDSLTTLRHEAEEVLREQEAQRVAEAIHALVARDDLAPAEIFVLSRKRQFLRLASQALRQVHIPYAAVEYAALMDAPEAPDLVALLDALGSPRYHLSLAQALRSPPFGASDAYLIALAGRARVNAHEGNWLRTLMRSYGDGEPPLSAALQRARELLPG